MYFALTTTRWQNHPSVSKAMLDWQTKEFSLTDFTAVLDGGTGFLKVGYAAQVSSRNHYRRAIIAGDKPLQRILMCHRIFQTISSLQSLADPSSDQKSAREISWSKISCAGMKLRRQGPCCRSRTLYVSTAVGNRSCIELIGSIDGEWHR